MDSKKIWVSHSSINDFNNCPRLYFFKSIYRNPKTGNRVQLVNPYLSLGSAVHDTIDEVINLPLSKRTKTPLTKNYQKVWKKYSGKRGGFVSKKQESEFKKRGGKMVKKVEISGLLNRKSLKKSDNLPRADLSENMGLVGSFDWIEILKNGNLHIIDFKTGKSQEKKNSWQLPIYQILAQKNYDKNVEKLSYWYLEKNSEPVFKESINPDIFISKIKEKAIEIKKAINQNNFSCNFFYNKCYWCRNYESIISGKAEYVGFDEKMKKDLYFLNNGELLLRKIEDSNFLNITEKNILKTRIKGKSVKETGKQNNLSNEKVKNVILEIKKKIKNNLTKKELSIFVKDLNKKKRKI